jgi:hypothetical protein
MILGVDPGRDKIGWALVRKKREERGEGELVLSGIVPVSDAELFLEVWTRSADKWEEALVAWTCERRSSVEGSENAPGLDYVALGDGTGSGGTARLFCRLKTKMVLVNERGTTLEARGRYWSIHRPAGWQRCLPRCLRVPPRAVDDLAAWVIALRSLSTPETDVDFLVNV